ncbi:PQQ-dependent sugar dehydrogenase [Aurantiacibacter poecillastricola]|uniref:PQQ-dependent sugar dehydrogenase n=1 Tax=Aurantiacibacter poecillastricola TaxID=3064385 RepID=UPI00273D7A53|nr:PQQ-dependent sugar dehydrogenase [Aurantiacibacter sp. 219JJ12-13]MDP5262565.1 PQQ-dependent sugar dehydrogenase [Aurantiacibacter sp. 219JJ12-13]
MRNKVLTAIIFPAFAFASCNSAAMGDSAPTASAQSDNAAAGLAASEPVELQSQSPFDAASFEAFNEPWALAFEPETGVIFITEKPGTMKFFDPATGQVGEVTGLPSVAYEGQGGLGALAFAPDYASNDMIYLSWAKQDGEDTRAAVGRGTLSCNGTSCSIEGLTEIWQQSQAMPRPGHYSHRLAFSPDGQYLYVASGDRQAQTPAQDLSNNLGGVMRLNLDGTPAAGNPFEDRGSPTNQIWTYGQRNILGLNFDSSGNLWALEHGPAGGDELNFVQEGNNYGWPTRSNGENYNGDPIPDHSPDDGFAKPAISWNPVIAPGGMVFYDGPMFSDWDGQLLIANLRTQSISRVTVDPSANSADEAARYEMPSRLRDIAVAPDGAIWVIEDGDNGRLLRLTPKE